ncbi:unnamed protein product [Sphagnum jensenii]|uniref:Uncharacterized protein n=1 Tax=Sphagnum jensenii TaxID=128206 RepID=A0ABP1BD81_9BRYO
MTVDLQVLLEHLNLASRHLLRRLQQSLMDGSDLVFLEVGTGDKSPIVELTIVIARSTQRTSSAWPFGGARWKKASTLSSGKAMRLSKGAARKRVATWSSGGGARWFSRA